jgi:hypothetical protein
MDVSSELQCSREGEEPGESFACTASLCDVGGGYSYLAKG